MITKDDFWEKEGFSAYLFIWINFFYGLGFLILLPFWPNTFGTTSLYESMKSYGEIAFTGGGNVTEVWGFLVIVASVLAVYSFKAREKSYMRIAASVGVVCWVFASIVYAILGNILIMMILSIPLLFFWVYLYIPKINRKNKRKAIQA